MSLGLSQRAYSCPRLWVGFEGKWFCFSNVEKNQTWSRADCHTHGANLAVIQSREELVRLGLFPFFILGGGQSSGGVGEPPFNPAPPLLLGLRAVLQRFPLLLAHAEPPEPEPALGM